MTFVGIFVSIGLAILGVPLALILGLIAGLLDFVPFIGPIAAAVPAVLLAFTQSPTTVLWVALLYFLAQQIEGDVISPLIQQQAVSLSPAMEILAAVTMALVFGIVGAVVAVPLFVVVMVGVKMFRDRRALEENSPNDQQIQLPDMRALAYPLSVLAVLVGMLTAWGLAEPYFIDTEFHEVEIQGLPPAWAGEQVVQISDWQIGMWLDNEWTIERIVDRIARRRPALVLITGDFVYQTGEHPGEELAEVADLLAPLRGISTYAVLGNHDYRRQKGADIDYALADTVAETLEKSGVKVLRNEVVALPGPDAESRSTGSPSSGDSLYLAGLGAHVPGNAEPAETFAAVPDTAARLVMMHHPDVFADIPAYAAPLAVAGHTHGGQIRLPFLPESTWLTYVRKGEIHGDGWIDNYGQAGNRLYVNRGIGFSKIPLRINCVPEMTVFTLRPDR